MAILWLLRHTQAEAASAGSNGSGDFHRALTDEGWEVAKSMGKVLATYAQPEKILCSPALRTWQTLSAVAASLPAPKAGVVVDDAIYESSAGQLLEVVKSHLQDGQVLLMVGHNPGLSELATFMSGRPGIAMGKGALIGLSWRSAAALGAETAQIEQFIQP